MVWIFHSGLCSKQGGKGKDQQNVIVIDTNTLLKNQGKLKLGVQ